MEIRIIEDILYYLLAESIHSLFFVKYPILIRANFPCTLYIPYSQKFSMKLIITNPGTS